MQHRKPSLLKQMLLAIFVLLAGITLAHAKINLYDKPVDHPLIPILDEKGKHVLNSGKPYSPKMTCGTGSGCHDYDSITHAYHFEMGRDESSDNFGILRGMSNLVSPGYYGGYSCMGGNDPTSLAKKDNASAIEFGHAGTPNYVMDCGGSCHSGGGWGEKDRNGIRYDHMDVSAITPFDGDYFARDFINNKSVHGHGHGDHGDDEHSDEPVIGLWDWKKSGVNEADCFICHADFSNLKIFPESNLTAADAEMTSFEIALEKIYRGRGAFAKGGNFREISNTALEFMNLEPDSENGLSMLSFKRKIVTGRDGKEASELVLDDNGKPIPQWNAAAFDATKKIKIKMLRYPDNENCMLCHRTSNSRRGFYGYGDAARMELDDDGIVKSDYQDDVHKGKVFKDDNGQQRTIDNCNICHSRSYFKEPFKNVELNIDHNFLKGNSDMDVRNDLDFGPNAKSCEFCHQEAKNAVVPSGHDTLLEAHIELWKGNGDMRGYSEKNLEKITQTHFDVVSCQGCHITDKQSRGKKLATLFRYRQDKDGRTLMFPYKPRARYRWQDNNTGYILNKTERAAIMQAKKDEEGNDYGVIVDPITHEELGRVSASVGRHGLRFGDPDTVEGYQSLKSAYDKVLIKKGMTNPDVSLIWDEINQYIMTHNTRPSPESVPCGDCHERKQSGAFSSLVSPAGIMGEANSLDVVQLPSRSLVDSGLVKLAYPYMVVDDTGKVTENVSDILYTTRIDPFMTALKSSSATVSTSEWKVMKPRDAVKASEIQHGQGFTKVLMHLTGGDVGVVGNQYGHPTLRGSVALVSLADQVSQILLPKTRAQLRILPRDLAGIMGIRQLGLGELQSDTMHFSLTNPDQSQIIEIPGSEVIIKLPYKGLARRPDQVSVITSIDGHEIFALDQSAIIHVQPSSNDGAFVGDEEGFIIFKSAHTGYFALTDL